MDILITNNPLVEERYKAGFQVEHLESLDDVLIRARDRVHDGHRLLTHPLSGSLKPNETPYKTVLVSGARSEPDERSVLIIEESLLFARGFPPRHIPERYLPDLQTVDLSLIRSALETGP